MLHLSVKLTKFQNHTDNPNYPNNLFVCFQGTVFEGWLEGNQRDTIHFVGVRMFFHMPTKAHLAMSACDESVNLSGRRQVHATDALRLIGANGSIKDTFKKPPAFQGNHRNNLAKIYFSTSQMCP